MDRGPLLKILDEMKGTNAELDLIIVGTSEPVEIRNVVDGVPQRGFPEPAVWGSTGAYNQNR